MQQQPQIDLENLLIRLSLTGDLLFHLFLESNFFSEKLSKEKIKESLGMWGEATKEAIRTQFKVVSVTPNPQIEEQMRQALKRNVEIANKLIEDLSGVVDGFEV